MQGESLVPLLEGKETDWREDFFYEHDFTVKIPIPKCEGIRTKRWKYTRYMEQRPVYEQLFDLEKDTYEENNIAKNKENEDILKSLRKKWKKHRKKLR